MFAAAVALASLASCCAAPNILWLLADDLDNDWKQRHLDLMPNLKRLASEGVHFINHVAAQPVCGPSRSSLLAGRYPHNVGYYSNDDPPSVANYMAVANVSLHAPRYSTSPSLSSFLFPSSAPMS